MCIIMCELSQNTTLQITHAVKEWDKGMLLAYTQMKGINSEESSTGRSGYRALSGKRNYVAAR